ncbi:MAG: YeeE/YedE family protein [Treponema sp.]|nr:YeeE/YedE family protein [Treponema sp.]
MPGGNVGLHLVIGSFIFGIGSAIAGCCASGTFIRIGEGCAQSVITIIFFVAGSLPGAWLMQNVIQPNPILISGKAVYLSKLFGGFGPTILVQLLFLLGLWIIAGWWEKKKLTVL